MLFKIHSCAFVCNNITQIEVIVNNHNVFQSPTGAS